MDDAQRLVYVQGRIMAAEIEMQAMIVENKMREMNNLGPAYDEAAFMNLLNEYGLHHNTLLTEIVGH